MTVDLDIEQLTLNLQGRSRHSYRLGPISRLAGQYLGEQLEELRMDAASAGGDIRLDSLAMPPIDLSLDRMTDDQAARKIASALSTALISKLKS